MEISAGDMELSDLMRGVVIFSDMATPQADPTDRGHVRPRADFRKFQGNE